MRHALKIASAIAVAGLCSLMLLLQSRQTVALQRAEMQPCKTITTKIVSATNARFEQFSELGTRVLFEHPSARDLSLSCTAPEKIGVYDRRASSATLVHQLDAGLAMVDHWTLSELGPPRGPFPADMSAAPGVERVARLSLR